MTREDKIAWLKRYAEAEREIDRLTENIQRWASRAEKVTVSFSYAPACEYDGSPQEKALDAIGDLQSKIVAQMERQEAIKAEVEAAIDTLENSGQRAVLKARYTRLDVCGNPRRLVVVAAESGYSYDRTKHLHVDGLDSLHVDTL